MTRTRKIPDSDLGAPLIPFDEARRLAAEAVVALPIETVPVMSAAGLVLADDVRAAHDVPGFDNSAMDGYAVLASATASASEHMAYVVDQSARIATGHPLPSGCDAVVPWEATVAVDGAVLLTKAFHAGQNVRPRGAEAHAGEVVLRRGDEITPLHAGIASALGCASVVVHRRPRVAVASSGDEIANPGSPLVGAQVYDCNRFLVQATAEAAGADVVGSALLPDDPEAVEAWLLASAAQADVIVTSGGASVGERDWIRHVVAKHADIVFWHVGVKPGKPVALAVMGNTLIFVLPGNPGATFACTQAFVMPTIRALKGGRFDASYGKTTLLADVPGDARRTLLCPARTEHDGAAPLPARSSQLLTPYLMADVLAVVPSGGAPAGATVEAVQVVK